MAEPNWLIASCGCLNAGADRTAPSALHSEGGYDDRRHHGGRVSIEGVQARTFTAEVPGSGTLTVSGTVDQLDARLAGSGDMQLGDLAARSVTASVVGSGRLQVQATQMLDASISGSGAIVYRGHPATLTQSVDGSGAIQPR